MCGPTYEAAFIQNTNQTSSHTHTTCTLTNSIHKHAQTPVCPEYVIYVIRWDQFITSELHEEASLSSLNIEWHRLVFKHIDKLRAWHSPWLNRLDTIFRSGWRSGAGCDLFSLAWDEEVDVVF